MNTLKIVLLKAVMVCAFCALGIVSGYSQIIIEDDIARVVPNSGIIVEDDMLRVISGEDNVIEELILIKDTGEEYTFTKEGELTVWDVDLAGIANDCYEFIVVTERKTETGTVCKVTK